MSERGVESVTRPRRGLSIVAAVLVFLLLPVSVVGLWNRALLLDTDRYVDTVAPLATDPVVQQAVADVVSAFIVERAQVQSLAADLLPDRAKALAPFVAGGAQALVHQVVDSLVRTEWFAEAWVRANRADHALVVRLVTGREGTVASTKEGRIAVDLAPVAEEALRRVDQQFGLALADRVDLSNKPLEFVLFESEELAHTQSLLRLAHRVLWVLVGLTAVAAVVGVLGAGDRWRGARRVGVAIALSMAALLVALAAGRTFYLARLPIGLRNRPGPAVVFDIFTRGLHRSVWIAFAVGVVVVVGSWIMAAPAGGAKARGGFRRRKPAPSIEVSE